MGEKETERERKLHNHRVPSLLYIHQQPGVNYLPRFGPQLISLEEETLRVYFSGEINLLENMDIVQIALLVDPGTFLEH